jgi:hypothetical protein
MDQVSYEQTKVGGDRQQGEIDSCSSQALARTHVTRNLKGSSLVHAILASKGHAWKGDEAAKPDDSLEHTVVVADSGRLRRRVHRKCAQPSHLLVDALGCWQEGSLSH